MDLCEYIPFIRNALQVLILSEPKAWAQDFAVYEASVLRVKQSVDSKLACIAPQGRQPEHKPESAAAELTTGEGEQLNEYEQARLQRIRRNQQVRNKPKICLHKTT